MSQDGLWSLPDDWKWVRAEEISEIVGGGTPRKASDPTNFDDEGIPWITPADLSNYPGTYIERGARSLSEKGFKNSSVRLMPPGTVLLTSRAPIGYCVVAKNEVTTNQGFRSLVPKNSVQSEYLRYYLLQAREYLRSLGSGTTFKELSGSRAKEIMIPLAPEETQRQITTKIDELFSQIDEGEAELKRAQALVKTYRASVLKAAVTGDLTRDWRAANRGQHETGADLLARILTARRAAWEAAEL